MDRDRNPMGGDDEDRLPEHEYKDPNTIGGGVMSSGGTAVERGTSQIDPSAEDSTREPGELTADRDAAEDHDRPVLPTDLIGGRAADAGEEADDDDESLIPPQARPI